MKLYFPVLLLLLTLRVQAQLNTTLRSNLDFGVSVNDVWGYVSPDGNEYAIVGLDTGIAIVSLADPDQPALIGVAGGVRSVWRDMKTYGEYAYGVADQGSDGLTVIDLRQLPDTFAVTQLRDTVPGFERRFLRAHNLFIDTTRGLAFTAGGDRNINDGGMLIYDLKVDPLHPRVTAVGPATYAHDVYVQDNLMYASEIYKGELAIYDTKDIDNIVELGRTETPFRFTHNAWTSENGNTMFVTDEVANAVVAAYDITDPGNIEPLDAYRPLSSVNTETIPHNVHVINDYLSISYYTDGLRVVDASDPTNLVEVANYDTWQGPDGGFSGNWGAYPFLPSGLTLVSDRATGLYVVDVTYQRAARVEGTIVDSLTANPINAATVEILTDQLNATTTDPMGVFATGIATAGTYDIAISAPGYAPDTISAELINGEVLQVAIQLVDSAYLTTSSPDIERFEVHAALAPNPAPGAAVFTYDLGSLPGGSLRVYTTSGTLVSEQRLSRKSGTVEVADGFPSGLYFLHLMSEGKALRTFKLVKL